MMIYYKVSAFFILFDEKARERNTEFYFLFGFWYVEKWETDQVLWKEDTQGLIDGWFQVI